MKISLVRRGFSRTGGAESYLRRLGHAFADRGHQATLYATQDWPQADWPYGKLIRLNAATPMRFAQMLQESLRSDEIVFSFDRVLKCDCYRAGDGVHQIWLERRAQYEPRRHVWFQLLNRKHREILELERALLQRGGAKQVIANSNLVKKEIVSEFGYDEDRITVIYNGLPDAHFKRKLGTRADLRRDWGLREPEVALLFAGSGWSRKGLRYLIQAVKKIRNSHLRLLIAGTGKKPAPPSAAIRFLGPVADMTSLYSAADLFVLPTLYDPFSNACLEALSVGTPVITTMANGFSEIIESGVHGQIIGRGDDIAALQQAIENWIEPDRRAGASQPCIDLARVYSMDRNVEQTLKVLEGLRKNVSA
jgi:UDP-glucose:(heptosyl)LPS alpha-1,3-glucosyltransferase